MLEIPFSMETAKTATFTHSYNHDVDYVTATSALTDASRGYPGNRELKSAIRNQTHMILNLR